MKIESGGSKGRWRGGKKVEWETGEGRELWFGGKEVGDCVGFDGDMRVTDKDDAASVMTEQQTFGLSRLGRRCREGRCRDGRVQKFGRNKGR